MYIKDLFLRETENAQNIAFDSFFIPVMLWIYNFWIDIYGSFQCGGFRDGR